MWLFSSPGPFFLLLLKEMLQIALRLPPVIISHSNLQSRLHALSERFVSWITHFISFVAFFDLLLCLGMHIWITLFQVSVKITLIVK